MIRRSAVLLSYGLLVITVLEAWKAFPGTPRNLSIALILGLVACAGAALFTGGFASIPKYHGRDLLGVAGLIAGYLLVSLYFQIVNRFPVRGWELVMWFIAAYGFFLGSQRSFLVYLALNAFVLFVALIVMPSFAAAAGFFAVAALLFAVLSYRERTEEIVEGASSAPRWVPVKAGIVAATVLFAVFGVVYLVHPAPTAAEAEDPMEVLRNPGRKKKKKETRPPNPISVQYPVGNRVDPFERDTLPTAGVDTSAVRFRTDLKFGDPGAASADREAVMLLVRITDSEGRVLGPTDLPLFWKTGVVTKYDGRTWTCEASTSKRTGNGEVRFDAPEGREIEQKAILFPMISRGLFALYPVASLSIGEVWIDSEGTVSRTQSYVGQFKYRVRSRMLDASPARLDSARTPATDARYLQVPERVARHSAFLKAVREIGEQERTSYGRINAMLAYFAGFQYSLAPGQQKDVDPTIDFLLRKIGYCQHFASAMALMLRQLGIPARIAVGFAGGDWDDPNGIVIVRRRHAHSWVEVHFEGVGWVPFDPAAIPAEQWWENPVLPTPEKKDPDPVVPEKKDPNPPEKKDPVDPEKKDPAPPDKKDPVNPEKKDPVPPLKKDPVDPEKKDPPPPEKKEPGKPPDVHRTEEMRNMFDQQWDQIRNMSGSVSPDDPNAPGGSAGPEAKDEEGVDYESAGKVLVEIIRDLAVILLAGILGAVILRVVSRARRGKKDTDPQWASPGLATGESMADAEGALAASVPSGTARHKLVMIYVGLLKALAKLGFTRKPQQTPREFASSLESPDLLGLTRLFEDARYGGAEPSGDELDAGRRLADSAEDDLRQG